LTTYSSDDQEVWDPVAKLDDIKRQEDYEYDLRSTEKPPFYNPEQVDKNKVLWLTKMTMKKYEFATIRDNEQILYFHREFRSWVSNGERLIKEYCQMVYEPIKDAEIEAIINQISRRTGVDRSRFNSDKECITTDNCYLNVHTGEVYKRSPAQYATIRLPHKYDPKARCPKIAKFLSQVLKPNDVRLAL
jgi:phage/plasmid-associated DNA primase